MNHWAGCKNIYVKHYNEWNESELIYKNHAFNLLDIENAMWNDYATEMGFAGQEVPENPYKFQQFKLFLQKHAEDYLDELLDLCYGEVVTNDH